MDIVEIARSPCAFDCLETTARFQHAKQALLRAQQQHCEAAHELLMARIQVQQMLAQVLPGTEAVSLPDCRLGTDSRLAEA